MNEHNLFVCLHTYSFVSSNKLLSVHPENATFGLQDGNGPLTIELEIPSEEVILRGNFVTELNL